MFLLGTRRRRRTLLSQTSKIFSQIPLKSLTAGFYDSIREEQAGFRRVISFWDEIFIFRNIAEQSTELNITLQAVFLDSDKTLGSIDYGSSLNIIHQYWKPQTILNLIEALLSDFRCQVVCRNNKPTHNFDIITKNVKQTWIFSSFLFILAIDWLLKQTNDNWRGILCTLMSVLKDLHCADDIVMLPSQHNDAQERSTTWPEGLQR